MTNPYDGVNGYNRAVDDAMRVAARVFDTLEPPDDRVMAIGVNVVLAIVGLRRTPRHRRRTWRTPVCVEAAR